MLTTRRYSRLYALLFLCLVFAIAGCAKTGPEVKYSKVDDPAEISNQCASNIGFDEQVSLALAVALKKYDGRLNDEFKLRAMTIVSDSDSVPTSEREAILKAYFTCLQNSAVRK